ncbi:PQQ-binding-like beta-propeller repeat protein [Bacteroidota bacterium]
MPKNSYVPLIWDNQKNIVWKTPIHGIGWSSPVIFGNQIWTTTATEDGKKMYAVCLDFETGGMIHDILLFEPDTVYRKHSINTYATPTPCIEKGFVYIHFGRYGTSCLNTKTGKTVWERNDLECSHVQGPGSSPIIYKDLLILHYEGSDVQYIIALDKKTGKTVWKIHRPGELYETLDPVGRKAYITPIIVNVKGKDYLISNGSAVCIAYDPETGKEIWRIVKGEDSTISMPVAEDGFVYFYTGFTGTPDGGRYAELLAVNPDGEGDIAETNILWRMETPVLQLLTPLIKDGLLYTVNTRSMMQCIDAKTGEIIWLQNVRGKFNASPVYSNGYLYFPSQNGNTLVIEEGREYKLVADNQLEGQIWATPAISGNSIFIRTSEYLYRIGK